jgi:DNA modification methylase
MGTVKILVGDCIERLKGLPDNSVQCCVTSPPYWGLRDYGNDGQIGLESTPAEFVAAMVAVFDEVRRVLRPDGVCFVNLGSSYAGNGVSTGGCSPKSTLGGGGGKYRKGSKNEAMFNQSVSHDIPATRSRPPSHVLSCGSDDTESEYSQGGGRVCPGLHDEHQGENLSHHGNTPHNAQCVEPNEQQTSQTTHDKQPADCGPSRPCSSHPADPASTTPQSSGPLPGACDHEARALVDQQDGLTSPGGVRRSMTGHSKIGTSWTAPTLVHRNGGRESFYSACQSPSCKGMGRCGLCWCSLAIPHLNVKQKDLVSIPHLVALALQADGWYLRQDIIWHKPNPMPESVTDRCTKAHEYIFLLTKSARYFWDAGAIAEKVQHQHMTHKSTSTTAAQEAAFKGHPPTNLGRCGTSGETRNARSVWTITTKPYSGAHFATFPPELPMRCIGAGSKKGDTILDPFFGAGTTGLVAMKMGRDCIGVELNPEYAEIARKRIADECGLFGGVEVEESAGYEGVN